MHVENWISTHIITSIWLIFMHNSIGLLKSFNLLYYRYFLVKYLDQELGPIYLTEMAERSDTAFLCRNVCWIQKSISYKNPTGGYSAIYVFSRVPMVKFWCKIAKVVMLGFSLKQSNYSIYLHIYSLKVCTRGQFIHVKLEN